LVRTEKTNEAVVWAKEERGGVVGVVVAGCLGSHSEKTGKDGDVTRRRVDLRGRRRIRRTSAKARGQCSRANFQMEKSHRKQQGRYNAVTGAI
jgi:hypothetical protein